MGEYATYRGQTVKIGTCEDMYYLRADQAKLVIPQRGNVSPASRADQSSIRFRFPWPDEDHIEPGAFDPYDRGVGLWDVKAPADLDHYSVQFVAQRGYLLSLPCPEGPSTHGLKIGRNGFAGPVKIVQQAYRNGVLALICACGGCDARYNLPTLGDAESVIVSCRARADEEERRNGNPKWWHTVADRIAAGYATVQP